jgi:transcriptional regulator with XRE-family HTH domain
VETRNEWSGRVAATVGKQVAHYRTRRRVEQGDEGPVLTEPMTLQQLSDRCSGFHYPIARSVLSKLEKGHRQTITVDEVLVLAQALGVPPVVLLFPLGYAEKVEVLPGRDADPWGAIAWFTGSSDDPADLAAPPQLGTLSPIVLWNEHTRCEDEIARMDAYRASSRHPRQHPDGATNPRVTPEIFASNIGVLSTALRRVREIMREQGMTPPRLSPETARVLGESPETARDLVEEA